jgi:hypothetical protein
VPSSPISSSGCGQDGRSIGHYSDGLFGDDRRLRLQQSQKVVGQFSSPAHARVTKSNLDFSSTTCGRGKLSKFAHTCGKAKEVGTMDVHHPETRMNKLV